MKKINGLATWGSIVGLLVTGLIGYGEVRKSVENNHMRITENIGRLEAFSTIYRTRDEVIADKLVGLQVTVQKSVAEVKECLRGDISLIHSRVTELGREVSRIQGMLESIKKDNPGK